MADDARGAFKLVMVVACAWSGQKCLLPTDVCDAELVDAAVVGAVGAEVSRATGGASNEGIVGVSQTVECVVVLVESFAPAVVVCFV